MIPGLFVVGTDTGVGKTLVTCAIIRILREHNLDAVGFKPIATGEQKGHWHDVDALVEASGGGERPEHLCPLRFKAPMAPVPAARREGIEIDLSMAYAQLARLSEKHGLVVAEGIGGLLVPLDRSTTVLDFVKKSGFYAVLVARAQLGTVNHTLLSLRELERAGVPVAATIVNVTRPEDAPNAQPSIEEIERISKKKVLTTIPYFGDAGDPEAPMTRFVARAVAHLAPLLKVHPLIRDLQA